MKINDLFLEYNNQVGDFHCQGLTLTIDEGGPTKTWHVKLQNSNGYDLKIE